MALDTGDSTAAEPCLVSQATASLGARCARAPEKAGSGCGCGSAPDATLAASCSASPGAHCEPETVPLAHIAPLDLAGSRAGTPLPSSSAPGCCNNAAGACGGGCPAPSSSLPAPGTEPWLHTLVDCAFLFKPCDRCSTTHSGREVLTTYFDVDDPTRGYCTYCPERATRPQLLQIRRSTYHEVIKAADVSRMVDVTGIQHYVINGSKVLFLRPRPQPRPPKGVVAPARCLVDGRQLMDGSSQYCSLRCKLQTEDQVFAACHGNATAALADAQRGGGGAAGGDQRAPLKSVVAPRKAPAAAAAASAQLLVTGKRPVAASPWAAADVDSGSDVNDAPTHTAGRRKRRASAAAIAAAAAAREHHFAQQQQAQAPPSHAPRQPSAAACPSEQDLQAGKSDALQPESPAASQDSGRSSTFTCRWQHKRKGEPSRSPLQ